MRGMWLAHKVISHKISPVPSLDLLPMGFLKIILSLVRVITMPRSLQLTITTGAWVLAVRQALCWVPERGSKAESAPPPRERGTIIMMAAAHCCAIAEETETQRLKKVPKLIQLSNCRIRTNKHSICTLYLHKLHKCWGRASKSV